MEIIKIILLSGNKKLKKGDDREWLLGRQDTYTLGRPSGSDKVDVVLPRGRSIAPLHAVILKKEHRWWIRDESKSGTLLNGRRLLPGETVPLGEFDVISPDRQVDLLCISPYRETLFWKKFCWVLDITGYLNYALLNSGLPFIRKIILYNGNDKTSKPFKIKLTMNPHFKKEYLVPALEQGAAFEIKDLADFKHYPEHFREQSEKLLFSIKAGAVQIFQQEIRRMSFNTWLKDRDSSSCISLASFVLPGHSYVAQVADQVRECLSGKDKKPVACLYDYFTDKWNIRFTREVPGMEYNTQKIRLPHHVLYDWDRKNGEGNCLDLSLLFASCLENLGLSPVIVILEMDRILWHALIGITGTDRIDPRPLIRDREQVPEDLLLFDPNGITEDLSFPAAVQRGNTLYRENQFLFALKIKAARDYNIHPLPFEGAPRESPAVISLSIQAREAADTINPHYRVCSSIHLLIAMLEDDNGFARFVFESLGVNCKKAVSQLITGLQNIEPDQKVDKLVFSSNFRLILPRASSIAQERASLFIMEEHLLLSLLETRSASLDRAVEDLGFRKEVLKQKILALISSGVAEQQDVVKSYYNNKKRKLFFF